MLAITGTIVFECVFNTATIGSLALQYFSPPNTKSTSDVRQHLLLGPTLCYWIEQHLKFPSSYICQE